MIADLNIGTYALLFPAVSLLFLSYTNRFLHLSALIRKLHADWKGSHDALLLEQISNLKKRLTFIKWMQFLGALCLLFSVAAMLMKLLGVDELSVAVFLAALLFMFLSLACLIKEVWISGGALRIVLSALEKDLDK